MREWLTFLAVIFGWALAGRVVLELHIAKPWAVALVWFIGLIWLIGWVVSGSSRDADYLLKIMGGMIGVMALIAGVAVLVS